MMTTFAKLVAGLVGLTLFSGVVGGDLDCTNTYAYDRYMEIVVEDGDHLNDYLTHMTPECAVQAEQAGLDLARTLHP